MRHILILLTALVTTTAAAQPPKGDVAEKSAGSGDKMICKRFIRTGSLVDGYRACKTKKEWERERENLRSLSVSNSCRNSGNGGPC